jgi:DNA topoisomerase IA
LPVGTKVIAVTNESATDNAKRQVLKRNIDVFGADNVIESATDCDREGAVIVQGKKLKTSKGTILTRTVCEDKR